MSVLNSAFPAALRIASSVQAVVGNGGAAPSNALGCLAFLFGFALLSIFSFLVLRARSLMRRSGKEKATDFTNLRSTGKTIVNQSDDEDSDPVGGVN